MQIYVKGTLEWKRAYPIHVYAVGVRPSVLVGFHQAIGKGFRDVVEIDEFFDARLHLVVLFCSLVQS